MAKKKIQINIRGEELKKKLNIRDGKDGAKGEKGDTVFVDKIIVEKTEVIKEIEKEETALDIANKLNEEEEIIDRKVIKGLESEIKRLETMISSVPRGGGGNPRKSRMRAYSLTSQCNGVTKTFTLPSKTINVAGVFGTQFPVNFDPVDDWTFNGSTLTLGNSVGAPVTGQTLWVLIETLFLV